MNSYINISKYRDKLLITSKGTDSTVIHFKSELHYSEFMLSFKEGISIYYTAKYDDKKIILMENCKISEVHLPAAVPNPDFDPCHSIVFKHGKVHQVTPNEFRAMKINSILNE